MNEATTLTKTPDVMTEQDKGRCAQAPRSAVKRSKVYLAAWMAAEDALPEESKELIRAHDTLFAAWSEAGWPSPIPDELRAASKRIDADPLASIPFKLRQETNTAAQEEWREENP